MPEQLLTILKLCLLALLYLFFLRVIRAVWVEVNAPRCGPPQAAAAAPPALRRQRQRTPARAAGDGGGPSKGRPWSWSPRPSRRAGCIPWPRS